MYTSYSEDLASRGFVVASLCHSDGFNAKLSEKCNLIVLGSPLIDFDSYELTEKAYGVEEFAFNNR